MISPEEIQKQALSWWKPILQSYISGVSFFPRTIDRIGKVKSAGITGNLELLREQISRLHLHSKSNTGLGYKVRTVNQTFRRAGSQEVPDNIEFESIDDYLSFVQKKEEWKYFQQHYELLVVTFASLKDWAYEYCLSMTDPDIQWADILKVCQYFVAHPRPNLYLRQLPIAVHTKFIEHNTVLIQSLLDFLIPEHIRNAGQQRFAERFYLRYDEPLIRVRILDMSMLVAGSLSDISIPLSDFQKMNIPVERIIITENKMNFLTLPSMPGGIAIWSGGGFNVSYLREIGWMKGIQIYYWGDIDEHGFQILHQIRSYYVSVESLMMDRGTFERFKQFAVDGMRSKAERLELLTGEEEEMYRELKTMERGNRLEQEKIPQGFVERAFREMFG